MVLSDVCVGSQPFGFRVLLVLNKYIFVIGCYCDKIWVYKMSFLVLLIYQTQVQPQKYI